MQQAFEQLYNLWQDFFISQAQLWLTVFAFDTARYLLGAGGVCLVLYVGLKEWSQKRRIQHRLATTKDIQREIAYSLCTTGIYASVALFSIAALRNGYLQHYTSLEEHGWIYTLLSLPIVLILHDAYFYWVHRAMHHPKLFRVMHRVHHLSRTPTPWAAYSFAPGEAFMMALFMPLVMALLPLHEIVIFLFLAIMIVRNAMGHSGIEFHPAGWTDGPFDILTSVTHHDMHHQNYRGNFGLYFTWWDRLMGTELPQYKRKFKNITAPANSGTYNTNSSRNPSGTVTGEV